MLLHRNCVVIMAKKVSQYSILLASPSDLSQERDAVEEVIKELNITYGPKNNVVIELLRWETHSAPGISKSNPQDLISKDFGNQYDIFIGLLWKNFGTPTDTAGSGTEQEFKEALTRFEQDGEAMQILFYFKTSPVSPEQIDPEQLAKILEFKNSMDKGVLFWEFDSLENFKSYLRMHIPTRLETIIKMSDSKKRVSQVPQKKQKEEENIEYGLLDYLLMYESSLEESNNSLSKITSDTQWIGQEIRNRTADIIRVGGVISPRNSKYMGIFLKF